MSDHETHPLSPVLLGRLRARRRLRSSRRQASAALTATSSAAQRLSCQPSAQTLAATIASPNHWVPVSVLPRNSTPTTAAVPGKASSATVAREAGVVRAPGSRAPAPSTRE